MPLVRRAAPQRVLQAGGGLTEAARAFGRAGQGHDRGEPLIRLSLGGASARIQQGHDAAHLPTKGLTGAHAPRGLQTPDPVIALGSKSAGRTLVDRHVPSMGRA